MKRVVIILFSAALAVSGLFAYSMKWARYDLIDEGNDITRGVAYSPDSDHVYVPTRLNDNPCVVILDAETGVTLDTLQRPEGGYSGGVYPLNLCVVDDDGAIYVGNLSVPAIIATDVFKVYKYETEESDPVVVFENALGGMRFGDSFAAVGSGENVHLYASGMGNDKIADLVVSGDTLALNKMINLPASGAARHGISPIEPGGDLWINGTDASTFPVNLIDSNGNLKATIPDTLIASGSSTVHHWRAGSINVVSVVNPFMSNTLKSIRYDVFSDGLGDSYTFDYLGKNSDSLLFAHNGTILNNNINGSAVLDYDTTRHVMYVAMGVNCVAAIHLDSLMQVSTPRDGGYFAMQIDGKKKEYTRYDKVAVDGDREFYATWGSQMMYLGITGNTLYAPYQDHQ